MSQYCAYDSTCSTYDDARRPIDLPSLVSTLQKASQTRGKEEGKINVLDLGCGTGNYIEALRKDHHADVDFDYQGLEGSQGMAAKCQEKLDKLPGSSKVKVHDLRLGLAEIPDGSVDVVMITQVLHHLYELQPEANDENKARVELADQLIKDASREEVENLEPFRLVFFLIVEIARVLRPGTGTLWCQTQTPEQHRDGFWWGALTPVASATLASRFLPLKVFEEALKAAFRAQEHYTGCSIEGSIPAAPLMREDLYLNLDGCGNVEFRNCDSNWSLVSEEELKACQEKVKEMIAKGEGDAFLAEQEARRKHIGQTTTVIAGYE